MIIFAQIIIIVLTAAFIAWPWLMEFFEGGEAVTESGSFARLKRKGKFAENEKLETLYSERDAVHAAIEELEFDVESGTLSNEDFDELKKNYEAEAAPILKEIYDKEKDPGQDDEIERQIMELRKGVTNFCPECGEKCREDDKFCVQCGAKL
jgi:hypothetical protein